MMKITTKSQIEILLPELKPNKVTNAHCYYFRPTIGNTHVSSRFSSNHFFRISIFEYLKTFPASSFPAFEISLFGNPSSLIICPVTFT